MLVGFYWGWKTTEREIPGYFHKPNVRIFLLKKLPQEVGGSIRISKKVLISLRTKEEKIQFAVEALRCSQAKMSIDKKWTRVA